MNVNSAYFNLQTIRVCDNTSPWRVVEEKIRKNIPRNDDEWVLKVN